MRFQPFVSLLLGGVATLARAQEPAPDFVTRHAEVVALSGRATGVADVSGLVLAREAATITLENGKLWRLGPIGGRHVAVAFDGRGRFVFTPRGKIERDRVVSAYKSERLDVAIRQVVLVFADSTMAELDRSVKFEPAVELPGPLSGRVRQAIEYASDPETKELDPDVLADLLNGASSDLFYAFVARESGDPVMFLLNPHATEGVQLLARARRVGWQRVTDVVSQFRRQGDTAEPVTTERIRSAVVRKYVMSVALPRNSAGEVSFAAEARLDVGADGGSVGPWVPFLLFSKLVVDSARWADGTPARVHKAKDGSVLWIHLGRELTPGDTRTVTVYYRGDLIDRYGDFFYIKSAISWYPVAMEVGLFDAFRAPADSVPPVWVFYSKDGHRAAGAPKAFSKDRVGNDITNALKFFQHVYGPAPVDAFYATEIPYAHGEAFPGLVHLSYATFVGLTAEGYDEQFRAHEVAHQWWGIAVDYATYHDRWLSEGLADFSGLWYMQTVRRDNKRYFSMLDSWRTAIMDRRGDLEPVWLGHRVASASDGSDYGALIYGKGAWVVHMLRMLLLDLRTMNEDRFTAVMRDFYATHRGKRASTDDLRRIVERHAGTDMRWFFDQWIYGAEIPTYRVMHTSQANGDGTYGVRLRVDQENVSEGFQMYLPVSVELSGDRWFRTRVLVKGARTELDLPPIPGQPKSVRFNDLSGVLAEVKTVGWKD